MSRESVSRDIFRSGLVRVERLELSRLAAEDFESSASTVPPHPQRQRGLDTLEQRDLQLPICAHDENDGKTCAD
jgi:hypothetical protein